jgi:ferrous iron transport protein B
MRLLLVGNPNCGKSAVFSRITGTYVMSSNYPGTTVSYTTGKLAWSGLVAEVVDVPGVYSLTPTSRAEQVATDMIRQRRDGDILLNIVDATHLERGLYLTLELIQAGAPMILVLNMWDETRHKGIGIDVKRLSSELGIPVIPASALTGEGFTDLLTCVREMAARRLNGMAESTAACSQCSMPFSLPEWNDPARAAEVEVASSGAPVDHWRRVGEIVHAVQTLSPRRHSLMEKIADATLNPVIGPLVAIAVIAAALFAVIAAGEALIKSVIDPLFNSLYVPLLLRISSVLGSSGVLHDLLVGRLVDGAVDFESSLGLLSTGVYVPLAMVLPYVAIFYLVLSFLEDLGYLARLAILADSLMHKVGLHGHAIISMVLGAGCNVPGVLSARCLECRRQRFIASTLISVCIPCMAQTAVIFGLVGRHGSGYVALVFATLLAAWVTLGLLLNKFFPGQAPTVLLEIPDLRWPQARTLGRKLTSRLRAFFVEAVPFVLIGLFIVAVFYRTGLSDVIGKLAAPVVSNLWGLPPDSATVFIAGLLRKDLAVGMMEGFDLAAGQMATAAVVLTLYFPCLATFSVLLSELGSRDMLKASGIMLVMSTLFGTLMRLIVS